MTKVAKFEWSDETTAKLIAAYAGGETPLNELERMFGRSGASIRAKLVSEKVYVPKGGKVVKESKDSKAEYVQAIRILTGLTGLDSLEKANLSDLKALSDYLVLKSAK